MKNTPDINITTEQYNVEVRKMIYHAESMMNSLSLMLGNKHPDVTGIRKELIKQKDKFN